MADLNTGTIPYDYSIDTVGSIYESVMPGIEDILNDSSIEAGEVIEIFNKLGTKYNVIKNADGSIRNMTVEVTEKITDTASDIGSAIDSNIGQGAKMTSQIPLNTVADETAKVTFKGGLATAGKFVATEIIPAVSAVGTGIVLGKTIDSLLYNAMPEVWDAHGMQTLNPETWNSITSDSDTLGTRVFNGILGLNPETKESQQYIDENALAYIAQYMEEQGFFKTKLEGTISKDDPNNYMRKDFAASSGTYTIDEYSHTYSQAVASFNGSYVVASANAGTAIPLITGGYTYATISYKGKDFAMSYDTGSPKPTLNNFNSGISSYSSTSANLERAKKIAYMMLYGGYVKDRGIDGVGTQDEAIVPDLTNSTSVSDALTILKQTYPELWEKAVTQQVVQSDGSVKEYVYVPIGTATVDTQNATQPITGTQTQQDTTVKATDTQGIIDFISNLIGGETTPGEENTDSTTGGGITPPIVIPTGTANALWSIYNPTLAQVQSLGSFLWSSNFIDQLLKMFTSPVEAIISLHKIFGTPSTSGTGEIKVGYLSTGVDGVKLVNKQYITVNCGSVDLPEYFGNVFDYAPFTEVSIYLPFIGIISLNTADVLRSTITVTYQIDVLTGACLAQINVKRDGAGGVLYQYSGSCAISYPLSSGSYIGAVTNVLSSAISGGMKGSSLGFAGAIAGTAVGGATGMMNNRVSYDRSGNFSGNAGAMAIKKPYLIITRPQTMLANTFPRNEGYPTNYSTTVGACTGYIEVQSVHVENIPATQDELEMIESALKSGVLV